MGKPQVTLTFAGDSSKLETAFSKVGQSARGMETDIGKTSRKVAESAGSFDKAGEAADSMDTKAMGFHDTMTGVQDTMGGVSQIAKGDLFGGFLTLGTGISDLGSGLYNFLIPTLKNLSKEMIGSAVQTVRSTVASAAHKVGMIASAVATNAMTVAQKALNLAMRMNPIGLIITGLLLLTAGVIWAYKNVGWFRAGVDGAMKGIKVAFGWVIDKGKELVGWFVSLPGKASGAFNSVVTAGGKLLGWFKALPGKIGGFFSGLGSAISRPFSSAFQGIKDFWNNTVGGKGFTVPGWIPIVGGKSFNIPYFHTGGIVPGVPGTETLAMLQAGERVTPIHQVDREQQSTGDIYVTVEIDGQQLQGRITKTVRDTNRELKRSVKAA